MRHMSIGRRMYNGAQIVTKYVARFVYSMYVSVSKKTNPQPSEQSTGGNQ
jgi:hypothetical protein